MSKAVEWMTAGGDAKLCCGPLRGTVVHHSSGGTFIVEQWNGRPVNGLVVLGFFGAPFRSDALGLAEVYVRGSDFVATFAEGSESRIAPPLEALATRLSDTKMSIAPPDEASAAGAPGGGEVSAQR